MRQALIATEGVVEADVLFDEKRADVKYRPDSVTPAQLVEVIDGIGFSAKLSDKKKEET